MLKDEPLKILFIINPISGGKEKRDWEQQIRAYFKDSPHHMEFYLLSGQNDETSVQHHINTVKPDRVVGVGGDGTIKMLAEMLQHTPIPLGIIPAGSANGMAKELEIPLDVNNALDILINGQAKPIDVIRINDQEICIHLSDLGLNAMLVKNFESSKKRGMWGYGQAIFKVLWNKQLMYLTIETSKEVVRRKAFMAVIANASKYGTGAVINPDGDVADGRFEVILVRKLNLLELLKMLITHKPFHPNRIEVFHTRELTVRAVHKAYFQVDGEYRGKVKELQATVDPAALYVMLPESKEQTA